MDGTGGQVYVEEVDLVEEVDEQIYEMCKLSSLF
jgi:hypothetical protein